MWIRTDRWAEAAEATSTPASGAVDGDRARSLQLLQVHSARAAQAILARVTALERNSVSS
jgi:hypothetical protein